MNPKKKSTLFLFALLFVSLRSNAQELEMKSGFFLNYGHTKVTNLDCYNFDNLMFAFEIKPEMFTYDVVNFNVNYDTANTALTWFTKSMTQEMFKTKFEGKKVGYIMIFEAGKFASDIPGFNRGYLAYTSNLGQKKKLNNWPVVFAISGGIQDGYKTVTSGSTYKTVANYQYTRLHTNRIICSNRVNKLTWPTELAEEQKVECMPSTEKTMVTPDL